VKQKIIANTIMFIMILLFIVFFKGIFGEANKMVGIVVLIIGLVISERDLTQNLKLLTAGLLIVNILMGVLSYVTLLNPFVGLILNLIFIFYLTYFTVLRDKKPYHFPFVLGYLFLTLVAPPTLSEIPGRLIALIGGTFMIVGLQWLFNSKLYHKTLKSEANRVLDCLSNRLSRILAKDFSEHPQEVKALESGMKRFMKVTHDRRDFNTNLTDDSVYRVTEMIALEKIYYLLEEVEQDYINGKLSEDFLNDLTLLVEELRQGSMSIATSLMEKWNQEDLPVSVLKIKEAIHVLEGAEKHVYPIKRIGILKQMSKDIDKESLVYKFALRLTILLSAAIFIQDVFNLEYGRWLCFTILALVQLGVEESNKKTLHRFIGTAIGVILFIILFSIFKTPTLQSMIVLAAAYIGMYANRYDFKMTFITVQALGAALIGSTGAIIIGNRVLLVLLGGIIAYIGNRYLFTIRQQDIKNHYEELYTSAKNHLLMEKEEYPHSIIVDTYHCIEAGELDGYYEEWLDVSFKALAKNY